MVALNWLIMNLMGIIDIAKEVFQYIAFSVIWILTAIPLVISFFVRYPLWLVVLIAVIVIIKVKG